MPHINNAGRDGLRAPPQRTHPSGEPDKRAPRLDGMGGVGINASHVSILEWFKTTHARLRRVRVACGDWSRVLSPSVLRASDGIAAVFLDPPYAAGDQQYSAGGTGSNLSQEVAQWAIEHGNDPALRIALCGHEGEHSMPDSWECVAWRASRGMAKEGNENNKLERIWFSPHCLKSKTCGTCGGDATVPCSACNVTRQTPDIAPAPQARDRSTPDPVELLSEVLRLRAENDRLRREVKQLEHIFALGREGQKKDQALLDEIKAELGNIKRAVAEEAEAREAAHEVRTRERQRFLTSHGELVTKYAALERENELNKSIVIMWNNKASESK